MGEDDGPDEIARSGQALSQSLQPDGSSIFQDETPQPSTSTAATPSRPTAEEEKITTTDTVVPTTIADDDPKPGPSSQLDNPSASMREDDGFGAEGFDEGAGLFEGKTPFFTCDGCTTFFH